MKYVKLFVLIGIVALILISTPVSAYVYQSASSVMINSNGVSNIVFNYNTGNNAYQVASSGVMNSVNSNVVVGNINTKTPNKQISAFKFNGITNLNIVKIKTI